MLRHKATLATKSAHVSFLVDSGATEHIVNNIDLLSKVSKQKLTFSTANGKATSHLVGEVTLNCDGRGIALNRVSYMPKCDNLLSLDRLLAAGAHVDFLNDTLWLDGQTALPLTKHNRCWYLEQCTASGQTFKALTRLNSRKRRRAEHNTRSVLTTSCLCSTSTCSNSCGHTCHSCSRRAELDQLTTGVRGHPLWGRAFPTEEPDIVGVKSHKICTVFPAVISDNTKQSDPQQTPSSPSGVASEHAADDKRFLTANELAHLRFGHCSLEYIQSLVQQGIDLGLKFLGPRSAPRHCPVHCPACQMGKGIRPTFHSLSEEQRPTRPGELVSSDSFGIVTTRSCTGNEQYAIHFTDHATRFTKVYFMKRKSEVQECFTKFIKFCEKNNVKIQNLKTDNAQEFKSKAFDNLCAEKGIKHQFSGPYMHESNGLAERIWRTLTDRVMTMLITAQLPLPFWAAAMQHAVYLRNRLPHKALGFKTPYELWYKKKPKLSDVRVFGCTAYAYVPPETRRKLENKAVPCIYLGNNEDSNTYQLFNVNEGMMHQSGMVQFFEEFDRVGRLVSPLFKPSSNKVKTPLDLEDATDSDTDAGTTPTGQEKPATGKIPVEPITRRNVVKPTNVTCKKILDIDRHVHSPHFIEGIVQIEDARNSKCWIPLASLLGTVKSRTRSFYDMFNNYLRKNDVPSNFKPIFDKVRVSCPDEDGKDRLLSGFVAAVDYSREDDFVFLVCFTDGGKMWCAAHELRTEQSNTQGTLGNSLDNLAKANTVSYKTVDWQFSPEEFKNLQQRYKHDVDACCDTRGNNKLLPRYWDEALNTSWSGLNVWCNPPFDQVEKFVDKFVDEFALNTNTSATFVLPSWPSAKWFPKLLRYFHVVKVYPAGSRLFTAPDNTGARRSYGPTRWPVLVLRSNPVEFILPELMSQSQGDGESAEALGKAATCRAKTASVFTVRCESMQVFEEMGLRRSWLSKRKLFASVDASGRRIPNTVAEAGLLPEAALWIEAWKKELASLIANKVGSLVKVPKRARVLKSKAIFKIKYLKGEIDRYKARFVACGYSQRYGFDYTDTYSPVLTLTSVRTLISVCFARNMPLQHLDFETAFLQSDLSEDIYVALPEGADQYDADGNKLCMKLHKSLYGLKQSPRNWCSKLHKWLKNYGFKQSKADPCLFKYNKGNVQCFLGTYVDDLPFASNNPEWNDKFIRDLRKTFKVGSLSPLIQILGMEVNQGGENELFLSQQYYVTDVAKRFGIIDENHDLLVKRGPKVPMASNFQFTGKDSAPEDSHEYIINQKLPYAELVGCLNWLARGTRPDISFAVSKLGAYSANPSKRHWTALTNVLTYAYVTKHLCIRFTNNHPSPNELKAYADSDWASDLDTRRSHGGMVGMLNGGPVTWYSRKFKSVTTSVTETEYKNLSNAAKDILFTRYLLSFLSCKVNTTKLSGDNLGSLSLASDQKVSDKTKHVEVCYHHVRELVEDDVISVHHVPGEENPSHIMASKAIKTIGSYLAARDMFIVPLITPTTALSDSAN